MLKCTLDVNCGQFFLKSNLKVCIQRGNWEGWVHEVWLISLWIKAARSFNHHTKITRYTSMSGLQKKLSSFILCRNEAKDSMYDNKFSKIILVRWTRQSINIKFSSLFQASKLSYCLGTVRTHSWLQNFKFTQVATTTDLKVSVKLRAAGVLTRSYVPCGHN